MIIIIIMFCPNLASKDPNNTLVTTNPKMIVLELSVTKIDHRAVLFSPCYLEATSWLLSLYKQIGKAFKTEIPRPGIH